MQLLQPAKRSHSADDLCIGRERQGGAGYEGISEHCPDTGCGKVLGTVGWGFLGRVPDGGKPYNDIIYDGSGGGGGGRYREYDPSPPHTALCTITTVHSLPEDMNKSLIFYVFCW